MKNIDYIVRYGKLVTVHRRPLCQLCNWGMTVINPGTGTLVAASSDVFQMWRDSHER